MNRFKVIDTPVSALRVIERECRRDERGFLSRLFCAQELAEAGWHRPIVQINHTLTKRRGTVRGLHFQYPPHSEMKLVSCLRGSVWDVAVDLRAGSPTFLHWHGEELTPENGRALMIPEGCAHGFQALSDDCELLYLHSAAYTPEGEAAINACDPRVCIGWPLEISSRSERDRALAMLTEDFRGVGA